MPADLEQVVNRALEKDRNLRYQSASDLCADLRRLRRGSDSGRSVARPAAPVSRRRLWKQYQQRNYSQAIEDLRPVLPFERSLGFRPMFVRGLAYLQLGDAKAASAEFEKIITNRGRGPLSPFFPLAHLHMARAAKLGGDIAGSRKAYQDFFALWKDADPDIPVLKEAKEEYAKLK